MGATSLMYEGTPDFPEPGPLVGDRRELWRDDPLHRAHRDPRAHAVGQRSGPTSTTSLRLRLLGSVGEPINPEAWIWYHEHVGGGRCPIVDTWWQTETGDDHDHTAARDARYKPGSATKPFAGVDVAVVNEAGEERRPERGWLSGASSARGRRCCALSRATTPATRRRTGSIYSGCYFTGDSARVTRMAISGSSGAWTT